MQNLLTKPTMPVIDSTMFSTKKGIRHYSVHPKWVSQTETIKAAGTLTPAMLKMFEEVAEGTFDTPEELSLSLQITEKRAKEVLEELARREWVKAWDWGLPVKKEE